PPHRDECQSLVEVPCLPRQAAQHLDEDLALDRPLVTQLADGAEGVGRGVLDLAGPGEPHDAVADARGAPARAARRAGCRPAPLGDHGEELVAHGRVALLEPGVRPPAVEHVVDAEDADRPAGTPHRSGPLVDPVLTALPDVLALPDLRRI